MSYNPPHSIEEYLRSFDFEDAEVRRFTWKAQLQEVEFVIDCIDRALFRKDRLYRLFFRFLGVEDVQGDFPQYVQNQLVENAEVIAEILAKGEVVYLHIEINLIRDVRLQNGSHRFYLEADDRKFEFTYQSGVFEMEQIIE
jgi:hypothetical protein